MDPNWIITIIVALITAVGGFVSGIAAFRKTNRDDRQALIDQLQEERAATQLQLKQEREEYTAQLSAERQVIREEREAYTSRLDQMWADKAASREHVAELRDHIWQRKPPPPPGPPPRYIH